jgi:hypothetical protein
VNLEITMAGVSRYPGRARGAALRGDESAFDGRLADAVVPLFQDPLVDFLAVNLDVMGCLDAYSDLVALDSQYGDRDVVTDNELLSYSSCQYQHNNLPLVSDTSCIRAFIVFYAYAKTICETFK